MLRVVRKAHRRKSYLKRGKLVSGGLVSRSKAFLIKDRGRRGRGEDFLHGKELKHGSLGEGFFDKSRATQERILSGKVKQFGEKSVVGKLHFLSVVQKRTNPSVAKRAGSLRSWVVKSYDGKRRV